MADRKSRVARGAWSKPPKATNGNPYEGFNVSGYNEMERPTMMGASNSDAAMRSGSIDGSHKPSIDHTGSDQMLTVNSIDKAKVHRRFSVRLNAAPQLNHQHQPLPMNAQHLIQQSNSQSDYNIQQHSHNQDDGQYDQSQLSIPTSKYVSIGNMYDDELDALSTENFNAGEFIKQNLSNATATKIDEFTKNLNKLSLQVDDNIKEVINKSLENLSKTSKDFSETELEIKNLKSIFNELNEIIQGMKETADVRLSFEKDDSNSSNKKNKNRDRSSILMLQKLWDKELQSLFNHVAGAQQLISAVPGRHVLAESGKWNEVNPTTMKALQPVHLFVLNDYMLIASKRRHNDDESAQATGGGQFNRNQTLIATQCWHLRDVRLFDLKTHKGGSANDGNDFYMIKLVHQTSKFIYRTERHDHYTKVLNAYRSGKDELQKISEKDKAAKHLSKNGSVSRAHSQVGRNGSSNNGNNKERRSSGILSNTHQRTRSLDIFTSNTIKTMKNLDDNIDELDIQISRKRYGEAIVLLKVIDQELNKMSNKQTDMEIVEVSQIIENLKFRIHSRKQSIVSELTTMLDNSQSKTKLSDAKTKEILSFFSHLDLQDLGRDVFLKSREAMISNLINKVEINGIIPDFITQISIIRFHLIKSTIKIFRECFKHDAEASCFLVDWCFAQVKQHATFLDQQLNGVDINSFNYMDCIKVTKSQVDDLKNVGVDVGFLLDSFYNNAVPTAA